MARDQSLRRPNQRRNHPLRQKRNRPKRSLSRHPHQLQWRLLPPQQPRRLQKRRHPRRRHRVQQPRRRSCVRLGRHRSYARSRTNTRSTYRRSKEPVSAVELQNRTYLHLLKTGKVRRDQRLQLRLLRHLLNPCQRSSQKQHHGRRNLRELQPRHKPKPGRHHTQRATESKSSLCRSCGVGSPSGWSKVATSPPTSPHLWKWTSTKPRSSSTPSKVTSNATASN